MKLTKIHEDKRGEISILTGLKNFKEVKLLKTKKGYARGGCVHNTSEHFLVVEGSVYSVIGENKVNCKTGTKLTIPKNTPHYIIALEDSVIMEWGANLKGTTKNAEMLEIVKEINGRTMIINVFKDQEIYKELENYNKDIREVCKNWKFNTVGVPIDLKNRIVSRWFDPDYLKHLFVTKTYPHRCRLYEEDRFNLILTADNYAPLFIINELFKDRKDILIEDVCGGLGRLIFFLSKLGFKNFSLIDNFSQVAIGMFKDMMKKGTIKYTVNNFNNSPIVSNQMGFKEQVKDIPSSVELYIFTDYLEDRHMAELESQLKKNDLVYLCTDSDIMDNFYCKRSKYDEFKEKLKPYEVK